ncbi:MAG TPA: XdhC family protein [Acidobacteriaceae bacterium]|jgi:xanthine dehydrogenase accessory factor|nr:XdhC family protein [Acidobacteriaceae bacterium]
MMRERRRIVELWRLGDAVALVTLVRVEGSSYRRVGARLLVAGNGEYAGSISGGCLEAEVVRKAAWMVRGGAVVERYSTLFDDTAEIPYGLGCGGTVELLVEPAGTVEFEGLMEALEASLEGVESRVVTWLPENGAPLRRVIGEAEVEGGFVERIEAPQRMVVFGAGDDAQPLVQMAALMGWNVVVVDGRPQWARAERFPEAVLVLVAEGFEELKELAIGDRDAVVVMTHSYEQDRVWLAGALRCGPRYLGLLGARHRSALLVRETAALLGWSVEQACEGLFAPVGLDLGGDGAEAIALAVVAEIQACCEGKLGRSRRMTPEMVEEQVARGGASRYLQAQCAL